MEGGLTACVCSIGVQPISWARGEARGLWQGGPLSVGEQ
jgi:hypothetical protein